MGKIINLGQAENLSKKLKKEHKTLVITGGCFDILHLGHVKLLAESKKQGDILMVLLENDEKVRKLKGNGRPINSQAERAEMLAALLSVDYVLLLPLMKDNNDYDVLIQKLRPGVLSITWDDPQAVHIKRQAKLVGAKLAFVIKRLENKSTTNLAKIISKSY
jgi:rfaE bifunctional protein nucleotidyltransferase chain/domain